MSFAICRLRKRSLQAAGAMAAHALRQGREVRNADPNLAAENVTLHGKSTPAEVMADIREALPEKRRKDAVCCVELLMTASPEAIKRWPIERQDDYFRAATVWAGERFGGVANVKLAVVHRDEATPHLQILLVPLKDDKLQANKLIGGPAGLRALQTDYAEKVGRRFGLQRGIERQPGEARPSYQSIGRWYAAIAAAGSQDRIPPLRPVPPVPAALEAPGMFAGAAKRAEYDRAEKARQKALAERQAAIQANKQRTQMVERMALIGQTVYGKQARSVGERLAKANQAEAHLAQIRVEGNELLARRAQIEADIEARRQVLELGLLEGQRDALQAEIADLKRQQDRYRPGVS